MQRNWIGKSQGAEMDFLIKGSEQVLKVYTTRPDTIFGVDFMVVAPELELVQQIKSAGQANAVDEYIAYVKSRSDVDRMAEKKITGCFTGAYAINPFNQQEIPIYISEYVLAGYGTGAIMAVPCGDERDFKFAQHFNIPITNIIGSHFNGEEANATKEALLENSGFLNGMQMMDASELVLQKLEEQGTGKRKVNYRMRDAGFSRQRYWGEPFPIIWTDGIALPLDAEELPLELPHVDKYGPGPEGEGPLANIKEWTNISPTQRRETSTMPGYAGSSWYFLRYMDPHNTETFCDRKASDYWNQVDLYIGGTEHAVGHLLYSRLWTKVLYDLGMIGYDEPFKKLLNQGMITGVSQVIYRYTQNEDSVFMGTSIPFSDINIGDLAPTSESIVAIMAKRDLPEFYFSADAIPQGKESYFVQIHVSIDNVDNSQLDIERLVRQDTRFEKALFRCNQGFYFNGTWNNNEKKSAQPLVFKTSSIPEKMSKRYLNAVNPDDLCVKYGADTFRMYEMFLGPVEASKPWDTKGIEGVHRFLRKLWRLFNDDTKGKVWTDEKATDAELKILHRTIKKIEEDTEKFSFNTAVSAFMICINDLFDVKCHKKEVLEKILILLVPYAPHIAEELWHQLGNDNSILDAQYPTFNPALLVESTKEYPISINGKVRANLSLALDLDQKQVEEIVLQNDVVQKWLEGKDPKKIIYVKNKMINVVV
jgi:leucyl-tRNA synthetase